MDKFFTAIMNMCEEFKGYLYVILTVCTIIIGVMMCAGGDALEKAKKRLPWLIIGALLIGGAITLGAEFAEKAKF